MSNSKLDRSVKEPEGRSRTDKQGSLGNLKKTSEEEDSCENPRKRQVTLLDHIYSAEIPPLSQKQREEANWQFYIRTFNKPDWQSSIGNYGIVQLDARNNDRVQVSIFKSEDDYNLYLRKCDSIEGMDENLEEDYPQPDNHLCDKIYAEKICRIVAEFEELEKKWLAAGILGYYRELSVKYRDILGKLKVDIDAPLKKKHKKTM